MTLEQKIDICLEFIATTDMKRLPELKALARKALESSSSKPKSYYIEEVLGELGVPRHLSGYAALVIAISYVVEDERYMWGLETLLYPIIAEQTNSETMYVKRNIAYALQKIDCPFTPREFINGCADDVKRRMAKRV